MGPLAGTRIIELAGIGPGPHAAMLLADWGADVVRIERVTAGADPDTALRGRTIVRVDLKNPDDRERVLGLIAGADGLIEGYRPGVAERLGLGPQECLERNPRLVFGRMTGWGQHGPWAHMAGHDLNYVSVTGILDLIGPAAGPAIPLNLVGDFGGGSMFLVSGMLAALIEAGRTGCGQVVDVAMVDGVGQLAHMMWSMRAAGDWQERRASNLLDGGAPFYSIYRCSDGGHVAVGCIEPQFYAAMLELLELDPADLPGQLDRERWPDLRRVLTDRFATRTRDQWAAVFARTDACVTPVLSMTEALEHPHLVARRTHDVLNGAAQPMPAPRFGRTKSSRPSVPVVESIADVQGRWALAETR